VAKQRVHNFAVSLDGFAAGPDPGPELHLAIVPTVLGSGERLFGDLDLITAGYECVGHVTSPAVLHARLGRRALWES
jgi:hypothetical protein